LALKVVHGDEAIDRLNLGDQPRFICGAMDARGNGQYLAEQAALRYGSLIEQVMLTNEWYRENMLKYKAAFQDRKIELS
jgi:phage FluMu gp28-like protein